MSKKPKFKWQSYDGRVRSVEELEDTHLANVILHVYSFAWLDHSPKYNGEVLQWLMKEADRRKLSPEFLRGAPYPFIDKDGIERPGTYFGPGTENLQAEIRKQHDKTKASLPK